MEDQVDQKSPLVMLQPYMFGFFPGLCSPSGIIVCTRKKWIHWAGGNEEGSERIIWSLRKPGL